MQNLFLSLPAADVSHIFLNFSTYESLNYCALAFSSLALNSSQGSRPWAAGFRGVRAPHTWEKVEKYQPNN